MTYKKVKIILSVIFIFIIVISITACTGEDNNNDKVYVVSTTTMLNDLVSVIGGDNVYAEGLMSYGIDPHMYKASAGDVSKMEKAQVVVYNGFHLEGKMGEVFETLKEQNKNVVCMEDAIDKNLLLYKAENPDVYDPHIWYDVSLWKDASKHLANSLIEIDSKNAVEYRVNLENYLKELDELEDYIIDRVDEVEESQRVLITAHDAFGYFGNAYGFTVRGLQGISTDSEAGTADVSSLANYIVENEIKAIFVESSIPPKNIESLQEAVKAKGFEVEIGGELYSDSLGDEQSNHNTYLKTFKANIDTIVNALK